MIVFSSDNGLAWGEHRWHEKQNPYEEGHPRSNGRSL